ncbi:WxL domain-containing protein [Enterococcus sp. AZ188]|uniref:WxL domain-containing protein n=1 Tax=Enterococcus sp. AZ188 TaxID=2774678 RepID=UPI003D2FA2A9
MKKIQLVTTTFLMATLLISGVTLASADEVRDVTTTGQIEFTPNTDEESVVIPPETDPDVEIDPEVPGTTGPLSLVKAVTMDFGSQVISNQDQTYNMVAETANLADGSGQVPYVSFAQVQDTRGSNAGWVLSVSISDFSSTTQNNILTGAQISLNDPTIQYAGSNTTNAPSSHTSGLQLIPNAGSVPVMTAETGQGAGVSSVVWGNQADLNTQAADNSIEVIENSAIQLFVPGSTAKDATTYTSTLSWELTSTPGADA